MLAGEVGARGSDGDNGTVQASAFKTEEKDGRDVLSRIIGGKELAWQAGDEASTCDGEACTHMAPSADRMTNYQECNLKRRIASGSTRALEGYGHINSVFRPGTDLVQVLLTNAAHLPDLRYRLFSLPTFVNSGQVFEGRPARVAFRLKSEYSILFSLSGTLFGHTYGYRVDSSSSETACAVLVPVQPPDNFATNINDFHCDAGHRHEVLLRKTA